MRHTWPLTSSAPNRALRLLCVWLILAGQNVVWLSGCSQARERDNDNATSDFNDNGNDSLNTNASDDANTNANTSDDNANTSDDAGDAQGVETLAGTWVVEQVLPDGSSYWGWAVSQSAIEDSITLSVTRMEGPAPVANLLVLSNTDGQLDGLWASGNMTAPDDTNWYGSLSDDGTTIEGTLEVDGSEQDLSFYRVARADYRTTGLWTRDGDGATAVAAVDRDQVLISVLDDEGGWPDEGYFDGRYELEETASDFGDAFGFSSSGGGGEGLLFEDGDRMMLVTSGFDAIAGLTFIATHFDRADTPAGELSGRWVGGDRQSASAPPQRGTRVVVDTDNSLYVHERLDGGSFGRLARFDLDASTLTATVGGFAWSGDLSIDATRVSGEWDGYDSWYNSMDRTQAPAPGQLSGTWSSVSVNWVFSDIDPQYGTAEITHDGDSLSVTDSYDDGTTYRLEATWTGDRFEGQWWNDETPDVKSPWHGELLVSGWYLHGAWNEGEWSFSQYPLEAVTTLADAPAGTATITLDPYVDIAAAANDPDAGIAATMYRSQSRISGFGYVGPEGEARLTVDERLRPTRVTGLDETVSCVWAEDSSSVEITLDRDGATTVVTAPMDLSDAGLLSALDDMEAGSGQNFDGLRDWVAVNPGRVLAVARGEEVILAPGSSLGFRVGSAAELLARSASGSSDAWRRVVLDGAAVGGLLWAGVAAGSAALGAATFTGIVVLASVSVLMTAAAGVLLGMLVFDLLLCEPCTLLCFWNCTAG